jgi:hypothetical protein
MKVSGRSEEEKACLTPFADRPEDVAGDPSQADPEIAFEGDDGENQSGQKG